MAIKKSSPKKPGRIIAKMNALIDERTIRTLYRASQAGVRIDLIARGICCLRPGVPGVSETIRVTSILDRFLERGADFDYVIANGDYCCNTAFVGVSDDAACQSAIECVGKLRQRFGTRLRVNYGDHELGKIPMFANGGGLRLDQGGKDGALFAVGILITIAAIGAINIRNSSAV